MPSSRSLTAAAAVFLLSPAVILATTDVFGSHKHTDVSRSLEHAAVTGAGSLEHAALTGSGSHEHKAVSGSGSHTHTAVPGSGSHEHTGVAGSHEHLLDDDKSLDSDELLSSDDGSFENLFRPLYHSGDSSEEDGGDVSSTEVHVHPVMPVYPHAYLGPWHPPQVLRPPLVSTLNMYPGPLRVLPSPFRPLPFAPSAYLPPPFGGVLPTQPMKPNPFLLPAVRPFYGSLAFAPTPHAPHLHHPHPAVHHAHAQAYAQAHAQAQAQAQAHGLFNPLQAAVHAPDLASDVFHHGPAHPLVQAAHAAHAAHDHAHHLHHHHHHHHHHFRYPVPGYAPGLQYPGYGAQYPGYAHGPYNQVYPYGAPYPGHLPGPYNPGYPSGPGMYPGYAHGPYAHAYAYGPRYHGYAHYPQGLAYAHGPYDMAHAYGLRVHPYAPGPYGTAYGPHVHPYAHTAYGPHVHPYAHGPYGTAYGPHVHPYAYGPYGMAQAYDPHFDAYAQGPYDTAYAYGAHYDAYAYAPMTPAYPYGPYMSDFYAMHDDDDDHEDHVHWPVDVAHMWPLHPDHYDYYHNLYWSQEGYCSWEKPVPCWGRGSCIALSSVCDKHYDCGNYLDEDSRLCISGQRPQVELMAMFLSLPDQQWMLTKLFNNRDPYYVALALKFAHNTHDVTWALGLGGEAVNNTKIMVQAAKEDNADAAEDLGMKEETWSITKYFFKKLLDTGFDAS